MVLAEAPHSLHELPAQVPQPKERVSVPSTFESAHIGEILQDLQTALHEKNFAASIAVQRISSKDTNHLVGSITQSGGSDGFYSRPREATEITRGTVVYREGRELKGIGFDAFPNGSVRAIAARQDTETGVLEWKLLKDLPENEKVRGTGSWKDQETGKEIPLFERAGDTVVRMLTNAPVEGRVAQAHLRNQVNPTLPEGVQLPDYQNKYLPTHGRKK